MNATDQHPNPGLTDLDWKVVGIARLDGPSSVNPERQLARKLKSLFGLPVARRLANDGAEALRRFCVRAWYWDLIRAGDVRPLLDAGYSSAAVFQILAHVARIRGVAPIMEGARSRWFGAEEPATPLASSRPRSALPAPLPPGAGRAFGSMRGALR